MNQTLNKQLETPILFLVFNRPDTTKQVFKCIQQIRPKYLYVASDGPRSNKPDEKDIVNEIQNFVLSNIDWECNIKTLFRDNNLGCRRAVNEAIDWFFKHEEMGIILEDDCLPSQSFFTYCEVLLKRFEFDTRIMCISGTNFFQDKFDLSFSYLFSEVPLIWGWASWRRAWLLNNPVADNFDRLQSKGVYLSSNPKVSDMWWKRVENTINYKIDTWDYLWTFTNLINNGLTIIPKKNLIKNIGIGHIKSTHTNKLMGKLIVPTSEMTFPLEHPPLVRVNYKFDITLYKKIYNVNPFYKKVINKLINVINYVIIPFFLRKRQN